MEKNLLLEDLKQEDQENSRKRKSAKLEDKKPQMLSLRPWCNLPDDLLRLISSNLFLVDRVCFSFTCKNWKAFSIPHSHKVEPPWFTTLSKSEGLCTLLDTSCGRTYRIFANELNGASVHSSKFGWLLASNCTDNTLSFFFFKPLTREKIDLPPMKILHFYGAACFSAPPTSSNCMVCIINYAREHGSIISFFIYNQERWAEWPLSGVADIHNFRLQPRSPIFCDGLIYCIRRWGKVGILDISDTDKINWTLINYSISRTSDRTANFIAEFNSEVFMISIPTANIPIRVFKVDRARTTMTIVTTLGNKTLFISPQEAKMVNAPISGMENKIYFPIYGQPCNCTRIGYYAMATREYYPNSVFNMAKELTKFMDNRSQFSWAWLEPKLKE